MVNVLIDDALYERACAVAEQERKNGGRRIVNDVINDGIKAYLSLVESVYGMKRPPDVGASGGHKQAK